MRFSELEGARIGVWGAGREIASFASQLSRRLPDARIEVAVFDAAPSAPALAALTGGSAAERARPAASGAAHAPGVARGQPHAPGVAPGQPHAPRVVLAGEAEQALAGCDVLVRSPGVSVHRPELESLRAAGLPVTTATSLWLSERGGHGVLAVTGTKGKSTTAALAHHLARAAGVDARLAGNIGVPALDLLDAPPAAPAVVELSSYQIADLATGPETAILTNLYREHTDWHGSEAGYRAEKLRLFSLPELRSAVLPAAPAEPGGTGGPPIAPELAEALRPEASLRMFGAADGWHVTAQGVAQRDRLRIPAAALPLPGEHNALNLCAALAGLEAARLPLPDLPAGLAGFSGLPHRLELVHQQDGVSWVNDSISTTPESTMAALASFPGRSLVLLAGGQDRGQDHALLGAELARLQAEVIGLPTTGPAVLAAALAAGLPCERAIEVADLSEAVAAARERAAPGAVVLLSPAAPSYDRYRDFTERGELFASLARGG